ncbi:UNVERIFIED_CONTAM: hypothetical protein Slati_0846300 [Sesamum latifolium]|uniref:Uncharacterized protein n=1 Tax=Sesamum latifolium TaxID=2727402 RepID=A0AAW2XQM0_9LAMI
MASPPASSDESSVRFFKEVPTDQDPSKATSRRMGLDPSIFQSGRRRSLRQASATALCLIDEEDVMDEGDEVSGEADEIHEGDKGDEGGDEDDEMNLGEDEGEGSSPGEEEREAPRSLVDWGSCNLRSSDVDWLILDFHIPSSFVFYTPVPTSRPLFSLANCLSFFIAQMRLGLRFPIPTFYFDIACFFQVPLNQLVPNSFRVLARAPPYVDVGERSAALHSLLENLNEDLYDCRFLIVGKLLGHFGLGSRVEPLGDSLNVMFGKLLRNHSGGGRGGGTSPSRSHRGSPSSSESKEKRPAPFSWGCSWRVFEEVENELLKHSSFKFH